MLSIKVSAMVQLSNEKLGYYGFNVGISGGTIFPISYEMNDHTKINFAFDDFKPAAQYFWSIDISYSLALGKKGLYTIAGGSVPMPGLKGSISTIKMKPNSPYTIVRDEIKMYSVTVFLGVGLR